MLKEKVAETTGCQDETKKKRDILCIYHKQETSKKNICDLFKESKFPWFTENYSAALKQVKSISILENWGSSRVSRLSRRNNKCRFICYFDFYRRTNKNVTHLLRTCDKVIVTQYRTKINQNRTSMVYDLVYWQRLQVKLNLNQKKSRYRKTTSFLNADNH